LTDTVSTAIVARALTGFALGIGIAALSRWRRALTTSGAIAAVVLATLTWSAGWTWGAILIAFFVAGTVLSRVGAAKKQATLDDIVEKGSERDWRQVLANGGVFAATAVGSILKPGDMWQLAGAAAIAASTADTWATEVGVLSRSGARSIMTFRKVAAGTSGGITAAGTVAAAAGALFIGILARLLGWPFAVLAASFTGGFGGAMFDSLLGGSVQSRRWCEHCGRGTERAFHNCGTRTVHAGGIRWLDNDMVNAISSLAGAMIGALFS
jgi:uncharacterized protein (TIGR00297 family)